MVAFIEVIDCEGDRCLVNLGQVAAVVRTIDKDGKSAAMIMWNAGGESLYQSSYDNFKDLIKESKRCDVRSSD